MSLHTHSSVSDPLSNPDCVIAQLLQSILGKLPGSDLGLRVGLIERVWVKVRLQLGQGILIYRKQDIVLICEVRSNRPAQLILWLMVLKGYDSSPFQILVLYLRLLPEGRQLASRGSITLTAATAARGFSFLLFLVPCEQVGEYLGYSSLHSHHVISLYIEVISLDSGFSR